MAGDLQVQDITQQHGATENSQQWEENTARYKPHPSKLQESQLRLAKATSAPHGRRHGHSKSWAKKHILRSRFSHHSTPLELTS
jgi:hypothetical protein